MHSNDYSQFFVILSMNMKLLSGFNDSALAVIFILYFLLVFIVFLPTWLIIRHFFKNAVKGKKTLTALGVLIFCIVIVYLGLMLNYKITHKGIFE
ncbi:hypothetical protein DVR12_26975 [Chitinophaga silvatica]|uniref:Uncharacterized protein n=1 Tax=Chitinophaga silvatica TaxID=2282649 RepID=A0A3E1Y1Z9_9BACT|nr:hypothetical protein DVR12_26975 [Chitinophaga silvatica]